MEIRIRTRTRRTLNKANVPRLANLFCKEKTRHIILRTQIKERYRFATVLTRKKVRRRSCTDMPCLANQKPTSQPEPSSTYVTTVGTSICRACAASTGFAEGMYGAFSIRLLIPCQSKELKKGAS